MEDDEMLLLDHKREQPKPSATTRTMSPMKVDVKMTSPGKGKGKAKAMDGGDSETEDEEDEFVTVEHPADEEYEGSLLDAKKPPAATPKPTSRPGAPLPTPARSVSPQIDPGRAPGRIIGSTYPLRDFEKNLAQGDVVTKAVADLAEVITEIILKPFASRRQKEMIDCMKALRNTCLTVCPSRSDETQILTTA
jgi:ATP-dependent DNA helicase 2 subunit 2